MIQLKIASPSCSEHGETEGQSVRGQAKSVLSIATRDLIFQPLEVDYRQSTLS